MDAVRISDRKSVYIKKVPTDSEEIRIATFLSGDSLRTDTRNHCVPILDVFPDDEDASNSYMIMPLLRHIDNPEFETVDDVVDFVDQVLEVCIFQADVFYPANSCSGIGVSSRTGNSAPVSIDPGNWNDNLRIRFIGTVPKRIY